jgi:hypothetical protein
MMIFDFQVIEVEAPHASLDIARRFDTPGAAKTASNASLD